MKFQHFIYAVLMFCGTLFASEPIAPEALAFKPDFSNWTVNLGRNGLNYLQSEYGPALEIVDDSTTEATNIISQFIPVKSGGYDLTGKIKIDSGEGINLKVRFYDKAKKELDQMELVWIRTPQVPWTDFQLRAHAAWPQTAFMTVNIYSWYPARCKFQVADLKLTKFEVKPVPPNWTPQFKTADPASPLITAADMMGPDGIVYPDFTHAGLHAVNSYKNELKLEDFGGKPVPGFDNYPAIMKALDKLYALGGGILRFGEGEFELSHPVYVWKNNIAIRGAGRDKTRIKFNYDAGPDGVRFCWLKPGQTVGPRTSIIALAAPEKLAAMEFELDGKNIHTWRKIANDGNLSMRNIYLPKDTIPGRHLLKVRARYADKSVKNAEISIQFDPEAVTPEIPERLEAVFLFSGTGFDRETIALNKFEAKRGDHIVELKYSPKYRPGDLLKIEAPITERWRGMVKSLCRWGYFRDALMEVKWVNGRRVGFTQPLRIDYPLVDGSFVQKLNHIENCEFGDLSIEQTTNLWLIGVFFKYAANCRADNLYIKKAGRHPFHTYWSRNIELKNSEFDDVWDHGGGGAGYISWEATWDSLMENVKTRNMRHAPSVQWASSGNVIRKSTFENSDAHWHAGWTNQNLFEQCVINSAQGSGSYGYGMWSSFPGDGGKGPNGPRNVVYNCTVTSPLGSVYLGGMTENWLILYNVFDSGKGPGILLQNQCFDTIIRGNVFKIKNPNSPAVMIRDPDCTGTEVIDNVMIGGSALWAGLIPPAVFDAANRKVPYGTPVEQVRPKVPVPSIYEWQMRKRGKTLRD